VVDGLRPGVGGSLGVTPRTASSSKCDVVVPASSTDVPLRSVDAKTPLHRLGLGLGGWSGATRYKANIGSSKVLGVSGQIMRSLESLLELQKNLQRVFRERCQQAVKVPEFVQCNNF